MERLEEEAWKDKFHGEALGNLQKKLNLHVSSVTDPNKRSKHNMSRIIPVVQASGTGKSRLAEE